MNPFLHEMFLFFFLSFFFSFFYGGEGGVGLARDGCLVRSWLFGHAVGLAVAQRGCCGRLLQKQPHTTTAGRLCVVLLKQPTFSFSP